MNESSSVLLKTSSLLTTNPPLDTMSDGFDAAIESKTGVIVDEMLSLIATLCELAAIDIGVPKATVIDDGIDLVSLPNRQSVKHINTPVG